MNTDEELSPEIHELLASGHKIEAIKRIRVETGLGLKEAKDLAEALSGGREMPGAPMPVLKEEGGASGIVAIIIAVLLAVFVYVFLLSD